MYKTLHGLILREVKYKESSKILTILTEEEGKITAEAKGVLRQKSKCAASAQCLVWSELTFSENRGRYTLTEGSTIEDFADLRLSLEDYALGCYFAELMETVSDEDSPNAALLHLGLNALYALSRKLYPAEHIKAVFEFRLMALSGFAPSVGRCIICGEPEPPAPRLVLSAGGVRCGTCSRLEGRELPLDPGALAAIRHVCDSEPRRIFSFSLEGSSPALFYRAGEEYTLLHLDRYFGTLDYWKSVCP